MRIGTRVSPIIVGGLGGSGTRVVAELLMAMGVNMGHDLNNPKDNLLFTLLLKRPYWFRQAGCNSEDVANVVDLHDRLLAGMRPTQKDWRIILTAALDAVRYDHIGLRESSRFDRYLRRVIWTLDRIRRIYYSRPPNQKLPLWGWKEPNTHIYLKQLSLHYPQMRYVHVIRHGLDMAFSTNQGQLSNWGSLFNSAFTLQKNIGNTPRDALQYWIAANEKAISVARSQLGSRFLLINYDDLCVNPVPTIRALAGFLDLRIDEDDIARMTAIPRVPSSMGRYRNKDLGHFDDKQIDCVRRMGFTVQATSINAYSPQPGKGADTQSITGTAPDRDVQI